MEYNASNVSVYVVSHKKISLDLPDGYKLIQVNCANTGEHWENFEHDDRMENISTKNPSYCELTALYWIWKNSDSNIKGLCHYRRFLSSTSNVELKGKVYQVYSREIKSKIISKDQIVKALEKYDVLVAQPWVPFPNKELDDLKIYCYSKDIQIMVDVINKMFPDYSEALEQLLDSKCACHYNILIANKEVFDNYCEWLFSVLGEIEKRCDISSYDTQHKRIYGYFAELLMNVYLMKNNLKKGCYKLVMPVDYMSPKAVRSKKKLDIYNKVIDFFAVIHATELLYSIYRKVKKTSFERFIACREYVENEEKKEKVFD